MTAEGSESGLTVPRHVPFLDLRREIRSVETSLLEAVKASLADADFILGAAVTAFERRFAEFVGSRYAIGVSNGLDALALALAAADIGAGDEVIVPANSFIASALAVSAVGARPVLVDCGDDLLIDPRAARAAITSRTKAIMPVHLTGQAADMDQLGRLSEEHDLLLIEDAAQAHGARYRGRTCGSIGEIGCFSFYPSKNLGALGDAGMVTTDNPRIAERVRCLANYGKGSKYEHVELGHNCRLDTLQAALLAAKLDRVADWNAERRRLAARYLALLSGNDGVGLPVVHDDREHIWHLFVVTHPDRDALRAHLTARGVDTLVHYPIPIHLQRAYRDLGYQRGAFPVAERLASECVSLPLYAFLSEDELEYVVESIRGFRTSRVPEDGVRR